MGTVLLSKRVENDESVLLDLIKRVVGIADGDNVCWATDLTPAAQHCSACFWRLTASRCTTSLGWIVHHAAATYRGDGKTDA